MIKKMQKRIAAIFLTLFAMALFCALPVYAHCEIPCGIYDDGMRITMLEEHVTTIEKSMKEIVRLSGEDSKNYNQLVRWIDNKDRHAEEFQHIVSQYFMTQRIKPAEKKNSPDYDRYLNQLTILHEMLIYGMKAKQSTDLAVVEKLRALIKEFKEAYRP